MNVSKKITIVFAVFLVGLAVTNEVQMVKIHRVIDGAHTSDTANLVSEAQPSATNEAIARIASQVIPRGIPAVKAQTGDVIPYGQELGVTFDAAAQGIAVLAQYEQDTRPDKLAGEKLERYVKVGSMASCEYCCGATTMVFPDGSKACGCAHSAAMRGVAAYLIDNYGDQLSDDQILTEVNRFKATYFPRQSVEKVMTASQGGQVDASALNQLSPQVGGC